jgi:hypothetical protein
VAAAKRWWVLALAAVVTIGVRLASFGPSLNLQQILAYDDNAYFAGAQMFVEGHLPYRSFPFVQPPGGVVVAAPFAIIGQGFGGDVGMAVLRIAMILMAGATAALIAELLRPYGTVASLVGSLLFATYGWASIYGRTFYLEPFLTVAVVWTFYLLRRERTSERSYVAIGIVLGIACTIKVWAVADVAVFAVFLGCTQGRRKLLAWLAGVVGTISIIGLPFFVAAPRRMWHDVITVQLGRTGTGSITSRIESLGQLLRIPGTSIAPSGAVAMALASIGLLAALAPLGVQLVRRRPLRDWGAAGWWSAIAIVELVVLLAAPVFYPHYLMWPIGALALGVGRTVGHLDRRRTRVPLLVALAATMVVLVAGAGPLARLRYEFPTTSVRSFAADHFCTWFNTISPQGTVSSRSVPMYEPCRPWPDQFGAALAYDGDGPPGVPFTERSFPEWNRAVRAQLSAADSAVVCSADPGTSPIDATTRSFFADRFVRVGWSTHRTCSFWELRPGVSAPVASSIVRGTGPRAGPSRRCATQRVGGPALAPARSTRSVPRPAWSCVVNARGPRAPQARPWRRRSRRCGGVRAPGSGRAHW